MKTLIASVLLFSTTSVFAHDSHFSSNSCDVDLTAGVKINKSFIEFSKNNHAVYRIVDNEKLIVNGNEISLTSHQQALITDYSSQIRAVVPEVKGIAFDAIELAVDGVNIAFNELLGQGNDVGAELTTKLYEIRDEVDARFSPDKEFSIDEHGVMSDEFFDQEFEQRIETIVEDTIQNSMGSLLIAVGQELLFAGGDMDAFEVKMEKFGEQIEDEMESRSEVLEKRGDALCHSIYKIDSVEEQLKTEIAELSTIDVISTKVSDKYKI